MSIRPLKVLLVSSSSGSQGGGELYLVSLAKGLRELSCSVDVLLSSHPRMDELADMLGACANVRREPYVGTYDRGLRCAGSVLDRRQRDGFARLFREMQPDVVHINKQNVEDGLDLVLGASKSEVPYLATIHITRTMVQLRAAAGRIRDQIAFSTLRRTGCHCIAIADTCARELSSHYRSTLSAPLIHRVWNGVADSIGGDRVAIRHEWELPANAIALGCVGRIAAQKNPLFLVELLPRLPRQVHLVWIGDGAMRCQLESHADKLGVRERVRVDGWRKDARQRMRGLDIFGLASQYEGLPLALLEAMATGLPCVASAVDGTRDVLEDGRDGYLCEVDHAESWSTRLTELAQSESLRTAMGSAARQKYLENYSLERMAQETLRTYHHVLDARGGR